MTDRTREDYVKLTEHWDMAFAMPEEGYRCDAQASEEDLREMAPSEKLYVAARSLGNCRRVLDYGCGSGWGGMTAAMAGCSRAVCADVVPNAVKMTAYYSSLFGTRSRVLPVCIDESWLGNVPSGTYDGIICSNVLDVVPPEMADGILRDMVRVASGDARIVVGLNYYMKTDQVSTRGFEVKNGNMIYIGGVLRLVNRTDEEWTDMLSSLFTVEKLDHFAWPGETTETRRLFFLKTK